MRKAVDERAYAVRAKLAEMAAAQRQIGDQVSGLQAVVVAELREVVKKSADETGQAMGRVRNQILGALTEDTAQLIAALALNENVVVVPTNASRYVF